MEALGVSVVQVVFAESGEAEVDAVYLLVLEDGSLHRVVAGLGADWEL